MQIFSTEKVTETDNSLCCISCCNITKGGHGFFECYWFDSFRRTICKITITIDSNMFNSKINGNFFVYMKDII